MGGVPTKILLKKNTAIRVLQLEEGVRHNGARELSEEVEGVADGVLVQRCAIHHRLASLFNQHVKGVPDQNRFRNHNYVKAWEYDYIGRAGRKEAL